MPDNTVLYAVDCARYLGVIFDSHLTFSHHLSYLTKSCYYHIRDLKRIRNSLDLDSAETIATSFIHSKLDYCNSLYLNFPSHFINRLQLILNAAARAVTNTCKSSHITPILKSLHWLKISQRIHFKIISLTYNTIQFSQPSYLHQLLEFQNSRNTRSSASLTLKRPYNPSRLKITDRSTFKLLYYGTPCLQLSANTYLQVHPSLFIHLQNNFTPS
jgi:hypothetical protein